MDSHSSTANSARSPLRGRSAEERGASDMVSLGTRFSFSGASHTSQSSWLTELLNVEDMDDEELFNAVKQMRDRTKALRVENELIIRYLVRHAASDEASLRQMMDRCAERLSRKTSARTRDRAESGSNIIPMTPVDAVTVIVHKIVDSAVHTAEQKQGEEAPKEAEGEGKDAAERSFSVSSQRSSRRSSSIARRLEAIGSANPEEVGVLVDKLVERASRVSRVSVSMLREKEKWMQKPKSVAPFTAAEPQPQPTSEPYHSTAQKVPDLAVPSSKEESRASFLQTQGESSISGIVGEVVDAAAPAPRTRRSSSSALQKQGKDVATGAVNDMVDAAVPGKRTRRSSSSPSQEDNTVASVVENVVDAAVPGEKSRSSTATSQKKRGETVVGTVEEVVDAAVAARRTSRSGTALQGKVGRRMSHQITGTGSPGGSIVQLRLNLPAKADMVIRELTDGRRDLDVLEKAFESNKVNLMERLESASAAASELSHEIDIFDKEVTVGGIDIVTGRVPSERFTRHVTEWTRAMNQLREKLRLRTSTLRGQLHKLRQTLASKAELGDTLTAVDFEQLRIDNERFLATIEQKNLQVIELKRMAGDCALQLSVHKKALLADRVTEDILRAVGDERKKQCDQVDEEAQEVTEQISRMENRLLSLRTLAENFTAPSVLEYARLRAKVAEQQRELRGWRRRVDLQETALRVAHTRTRAPLPRGPKWRGRPCALVCPTDDEHNPGFQKFWFGGIAGEDEEGAQDAEGDGDGDAWVDIPDSFVKGEAEPRASLRPCSPPTPPADARQRSARRARAR